MMVLLVIVVLLFWSVLVFKATRHLQQYDALAELMLAQFSQILQRMMARKRHYDVPPMAQDMPIRRGMML